MHLQFSKIVVIDIDYVVCGKLLDKRYPRLFTYKKTTWFGLKSITYKKKVQW